MADKIRWGILSTSTHAAKTVIPAMQQAADTEVWAVGSRSEDSAREYADALGIPHAYGSYEALLADPQVQVVYIPLPNSLHKEWALRAAEAGKHVLCEKPLGIDAVEAEEMVRAFRAAGLKLAEAFQWRHHPQAQKVRALIDAGAIGTVRLIDAGFSFALEPGAQNIRWQPEVGGGALYDVGCYTVALTRYITRAEPRRVTAQAVWGATGVDDLLVGTLEFPGGVLATINCGFTLPFRRYFEVSGSEGSLVANRTYNPKGDFISEVVQLGEDRLPVQTFEVGAVNAYTRMIEEFSAAVRDDREPLFPAEDAIGNMRAIDALYRAARDGGTVEVEAG